MVALTADSLSNLKSLMVVYMMKIVLEYQYEKQKISENKIEIECGDSDNSDAKSCLKQNKILERDFEAK